MAHNPEVSAVSASHVRTRQPKLACCALYVHASCHRLVKSGEMLADRLRRHWTVIARHGALLRQEATQWDMTRRLSTRRTGGPAAKRDPWGQNGAKPAEQVIQRAQLAAFDLI
jgi:hypothetical protein